jgi:hypothetical protein
MREANPSPKRKKRGDEKTRGGVTVSPKGATLSKLIPLSQKKAPQQTLTSAVVFYVTRD